MGRKIGRLGRVREPVDLEFDYFGETLRVHPGATDAVEAEFREEAFSVDLDDLVGLDATKFSSLDVADQQRVLIRLDAAQQQGFRALLKALRGLIHPDDFDRYWDLGNKHGQQIRDRMADIKAITEAVLAEVTDFPTGQPADSTGGQTTVQLPSEDASSSPEPVALPGHPATASDLERSLALERGRPDIQEFYVMVQEEKEQAEREAREAAERDRRKLAEAGLN